MQKHWLKRIGAPDLIVVALGWASEPRLVQNIPTEGYDVLVLYDYRTLEPLAAADTASYGQITLLAWSFGVWAAGRIFGESPVGWDTATAIGGTPRPVSDRYGIPERAFAVTVRSIGGAGTVKFLERMCGTPEILREYYRHRSTRPLEEIYEELLSLRRQALAAPPELPEPGFWTRAVVGGRDAIFPPEQMRRYWNEAGVPVEVCPDMPHYPLYEPHILTSCIAPDETR